MINTHKTIQTEEALREVIPSYSKMLDKRVQKSLDFFSREFMTKASIAILGTSNNYIPMIPIHYQNNGIIINNNEIVLNNLANIIVLTDSPKPSYASLFFIVPGVGHSLRINGLLQVSTDKRIIFKITGVYFHCARAAVRSEFWGYANHEKNLELCADNILGHSPYVLLKTMNNAGHTELSPRGDEAGFIQKIDNNTLFIPERPGNKVAVSLRNIIQNPNVELLIMVPGYSHTQNIHGHAYVTVEAELLSRCTVNGKQPKAGIVITVHRQNFQANNALEQSGLWDATKAVDKKTLTAFPKALSSHINGTGLMGKVTNTIVGAIVKHDMNNLY
jgi:predicted pyridoxine 5'-phosphate oxidase superfamily flavin-nucleotide-binding protein